MKACPGCGALNNDKSTFCISCGNKIEEKILFCRYCGNKILSTNKFCKSCGNEVRKSAPISQQKDISKISQIPPQKKKRNKKLIITLSIILPIFFIFLVVILFIVISIFPLTNPEEIKAELGPDQERVIKLFGYPDQFLIMFDEGNNNNRIDAWTYSEMETIFIFENGTYDSTEEYFNKVILEDKQEVFPDNFIYAMTPDEIKTLISKESVESFDESTGLKVLTFSKGDIICIFNPDDELIIVSKQLKLSGDI